MAIRITLECGHASMLRPRTTPEGYTHDWEVFVRGVDNADISQYVDKVVFQLHETFPKPKRVLKDAPYVLKESGYAGFVLPIYIYLKNKDEPKKIEISYDLVLQPSGPATNTVIRHSEVIANPPDDFRRKLLKGGGVSVSTSNETHDKSESKVSVQMVGKPKLSGADSKKHRPMEPRSTNQFAHLFGVPIKTGNKVSPETKKTQEKANYHKPPPEKSEKPDKPSKSKYSPHKDPKKEKTDEKKDKKEKDPPKDKDRSKEKVKRPQSPPKSDYQSPVPKRPQSPASKKQLSPHDSNIQKSSSSPKIRDKEHKKSLTDREKHPEKAKEPVKPPEELKTDKKKKKHKDDKESERKEKNRDKNKEKSKDPKPPENKKSEKHEKPEKQDKEKLQENRPQKEIKKSPKPLKDGERSSSRSRPEVDKSKEQKVDKERQKHKHRKKDKKERSDDSREREKRDKKDKQKVYDKDLTVAPIANPLSTLLAEVDRDSSDSMNSGDDDDHHKPVVSAKNDADGGRLAPEMRLRPVTSPSGSAGKIKGEKVKREKSKPRADDRERKRKRRSDSKGDDDVPAKRDKDPGFSPPLEPVSSSQSPVAADIATNYNSVKEEDLRSKEAFETEQIAPDSTNNILVESEGDEPLVFSEDYVSQLKELQQKIMTLQDNQELQRVVQVIAATGQYEITRKTFDFDLCALDRRTVQRLQQFFSAS